MEPTTCHTSFWMTANAHSSCHSKKAAQLPLPSPLPMPLQGAFSFSPNGMMGNATIGCDGGCGAIHHGHCCLLGQRGVCSGASPLIVIVVGMQTMENICHGAVVVGIDSSFDDAGDSPVAIQSRQKGGMRGGEEENSMLPQRRHLQCDQPRFNWSEGLGCCCHFHICSVNLQWRCKQQQGHHCHCHQH